MDRIYEHEKLLGKYLYEQLSQVDSLQLYGPSIQIAKGGRTGLVAFNSAKVHASDLAFFLDQSAGVAVRSGHHCTQPLHKILGVPGSIRASTYFFNNKEDIDIFLAALRETIEMFENL